MDDIYEFIRRYQIQQPPMTPGMVQPAPRQSVEGVYGNPGKAQGGRDIRFDEATGLYEEFNPYTGVKMRDVDATEDFSNLKQGFPVQHTAPLMPLRDTIGPQVMDQQKAAVLRRLFPTMHGLEEYDKATAEYPDSRGITGKPPPQSQFPGAPFQPQQAKGEESGAKTAEPIAKAVLGQTTRNNDQEYRARLAQILRGDRFGRAISAGEPGMSNALKLILTTGSAIRLGAPPVPQLQPGRSGEALSGHADMQMRALEGEENRDVRKSQIESNNEYRQFLQEQRLRSQERSDMLAGRLPPKGQDQLIFADNALAAINRIRASYPKIESGIGPVEGRIHSVLVDVGIADPNMAVTNANLVELMARQVQSISGVAVSNQEFNRLRQAGPNIAQDPAQFKALLDNFEEIVRTRKNQVLDMYGKMGFNVDPLREEGPGGRKVEGGWTRFRIGNRVGSTDNWEALKRKHPDAELLQD